MHDLAIANEATDPPLAADIGRVAVAFGVGALDAYLCDAFTDTLARCLKSCRQNAHAVPSGYRALELPIGPLMAEYRARQNWGLRMAARALMEKDNMLQLGRLKALLNPALPVGCKLWEDLAQSYVDLDRKRLAGIRKSECAALTGQAKAKAPRAVSAAVLARMGQIVQRRHDVVHNCDRPKTAKQPLTLVQAKKMLTDVGDFVSVLDDHLAAYRVYSLAVRTAGTIRLRGFLPRERRLNGERLLPPPTPTEGYALPEGRPRVLPGVALADEAAGDRGLRGFSSTSCAPCTECRQLKTLRSPPVRRPRFTGHLVGELDDHALAA